MARATAGARAVLDRITSDMGAALMGVVDGAALPTLLVMGAAVLFKGLRTQGITGVFGRSAAALLLMLAGLYLVYGLLAPERFTLSHWAAHTEASWSTVMGATGLTMVGYYMVALVGVALVYAVKSLLHKHE